MKASEYIPYWLIVCLGVTELNKSLGLFWMCVFSAKFYLSVNGNIEALGSPLHVVST